MTDTQRLYKDLINYSYSGKDVLLSITTPNGLSYNSEFTYDSFQEYENRRYFEINSITATEFTVDTHSIKSITWDSFDNEYMITTDSYKLYLSFM